jgi:hypothetical protein
MSATATEPTVAIARESLREIPRHVKSIAIDAIAAEPSTSAAPPPDELEAVRCHRMPSSR